MVRKMNFKGSFYPSGKNDILNFIKKNLNNEENKKNIKGVILPHAGWTFSGKTALLTLSKIKNIEQYKTFIIFGAVHTRYLKKPVLYHEGEWETPLGNIKVDEQFINKNNFDELFTLNKSVHKGEHSIEVQLPFLKYLNSEAKIVPISIPHDLSNIEKYKNFFKNIKNEKCMFIASSDLTHYGYRFNYAPKGTDESALNWVIEEKDKNFINLIKRKKYKKIIPYSNRNNSACGSGGIALITAVLDNYNVNLEHYTTSYDEAPGSGHSSFVTYAGISFSKKE